MFFTTPVSTSPYSPDYYPRYRPGISFVVPALATKHLAEQRERARALRYQQQPVNQPNPIALLAHEYNELPDQQRMMCVLRTCRPQDEKNIGYIMALEHAKMQRANHTAHQTAEMQWFRIREWQYLVALNAHFEEEQAFARRRADAEKFLEEAETYLSGFLPPDEEPCLSAFQPFELPDTPLPTSTSQVLVQDEPLLRDMIEDCVVTENRVMTEYQFEVRDTLQSILDCLSAVTSTEGPIEHIPVPSTAAEISSSMQVNVDEEGTTSS
ncbi:hypothetical protein DFJ58DRAFT_113551 [Suillus subalutaceus]|uniref:uncharacterized protein n=1 Tax=Suillus subalutaceus TaxID=48586 RepID=UPI001B873D9C|nr:uncharacterized protein DFJ58DRAFT_113551 [Suillus subalutaceus]KAG1867815.1 hypothetical protein DFJ58DRAFT_113551 [Suillus subalutaceus]